MASNVLNNGILVRRGQSLWLKKATEVSSRELRSREFINQSEEKR